MDELPTPPAMKNGWPWTEESQQIAERLPTGEAWPRVSIVTPSYNQAAYIEETIRSVLLQGYPNLEYIIIDGGSTDGTVDIVRRYERWLAYWSSEPDKGQGHAINKGFDKATGEIFGWLNSDDRYCKGALELVGRRLLAAGDVAFLYGDCDVIDSKGSKLNHIKSQSGGPAEFLASSYIPQPSTFFRRTAWEVVGGIDATFHYSLDYDLWLRMMLEGLQSLYVPVTLSCFRRHDDSKSSKDLIKFGFDMLAVMEKLSKRIDTQGLQNAKTKGYNQAYWMLSSGYREYIDAGDWEQKEGLRGLVLWDRFSQTRGDERGKGSSMWLECFYRMGQYCCLQDLPEKGRRYFEEIIKTDRLAYKVIISWMVSLMGTRAYRAFMKTCIKLKGREEHKC